MFGLLNSLRVGNVLSLTVSGYASSISNTTSFEKSVLSEVLCHDLSKTADASIFSETARLEHKGRPTKSTQQVVSRFLHPLSSSSIYSCFRAYMEPAGLCSKNDVVLLHGEDLQACQVYLHVEVNEICWSLLGCWKFLEKDSSGCHAPFEKTSDAVFLQTSAIACTVPYMHFRGDIYKVIVPIDRR